MRRHHLCRTRRRARGEQFKLLQLHPSQPQPHLCFVKSLRCASIDAHSCHAASSDTDSALGGNNVVFINYSIDDTACWFIPLIYQYMESMWSFGSGALPLSVTFTFSLLISFSILLSHLITSHLLRLCRMKNIFIHPWCPSWSSRKIQNNIKICHGLHFIVLIIEKCSQPIIYHTSWQQ